MTKKHRENGRSTGKSQGKHREFGINWSVATLSCELQLQAQWNSGGFTPLFSPLWNKLCPFVFLSYYYGGRWFLPQNRPLTNRPTNRVTSRTNETRLIGRNCLVPRTLFSWTIWFTVWQVWNEPMIWYFLFEYLWAKEPRILPCRGPLHYLSNCQDLNQGWWQRIIQLKIEWSDCK